MISRSLPYCVEIDGKEHAITNRCDFRMVIDVITILNDEEYSMPLRLEMALSLFYEEPREITNGEKALSEMFKIINLGEEPKGKTEKVKPVMDWNHDYNRIIPPINRVLGYDARDPERFTHWWTLVGAYGEIGGECAFANIVSIRQKKNNNKKLEKHEEEFYRANRDIINIPRAMTQEERDWLSDDW